MKKVSLILTTYNSRDNFIRTYKSICEQTYPQIEIIIVDGASIDGTREEIEICAQKDPAIRWISEKDGGIYEAMNKGLRMATGDIIAFFNDEFLDDTAVEQYVEAISKSGCDGAHSDLVYSDEKGRVIRKWKMGNGELRQGWMPGHPTLYLKREIYERYGKYREDYQCSADYEFMVRVLKGGTVKITYIPKTLIRMFYGGTSSNGLRAYWVSFWEGVRALHENGVKGAMWISILRALRVTEQFIWRRR